ncbi:NAD-binding protein [Mycena crocata]|nr:NAD-binding protein [Mycena crocata]
MPTKFFLTGATGYIGGTVLARFLAHPSASDFHWTVLVRDSEKAKKIEQLGVTAVVGSLTDLQLVETLASAADVVIDTADADDVSAANAILKGLKKRNASSGTIPIFIHTSGTGVLVDDARGMYAGGIVYDDSDADQIETLAPTQPHRPVDLVITAADAEGYVKTYIVVPGAIYGLATGPLVDMGVQNHHSIQIPILVRAAVERGRSGMVGEGKNVWPYAEIHEVADLYIKLYDAIVADLPAAGHGREGYYFAASEEHSVYEAAAAVGSALVAVGKGENAEPTAFTQAELDKYFWGAWVLGTNSRCRATRSFAIGWKPVKTGHDFLESVQPEMEIFLQKLGGTKM